MKAVIFIISLLLASYSAIQKPVYAQLKDKTFSVIGEWERTENLGEGNISKIIFYPDGTLNMINKKRNEVRVLRYRLQNQTDPLQGEIITAPFGLGQLKDRIPFTIHFNSPTTIDFKYTTANKTQTVYLKKVKDIPHGIIPLSAP